MATITEIKAEQLRRPDTPEGLILQGCGGDLQEWVTGINDMLTEENILLDGSRFEQASVFEHQGLTNLFLPFDDVKLDMGKLAIWRLNTREQFGSMWRSDYVDNRLGGPLEENVPAQKAGLPSHWAERKHLQPDGDCQPDTQGTWHGGTSQGNAEPHYGIRQL